VTEALRVLFQETGHRVTTADSVRSAVAACRADRPDVMLLDITLPDGDGVDVMRELTDDGAPPPTYALTGHDDPVTTARCVEAGCVEVLVKPVPARILLAKVRSLLGA
jgi:DNA-binding response OmpR family regulator